MPALITAADVKRWLPGLTGTGEDALLTVLAAQAEDFAARWCGLPEVSGACSFYSTTYTLFSGYDGVEILSDGRSLMLPVANITSVTTVHDDPNEEWAAASLVAAGDYSVRGNRIVLLRAADHGAWSTVQGAIKVVAVAGYTTAPPALASAMAQLAAYLFRERHRQGQTNTSEGGRSSGFATGWPETVVGLLSPFRVVIQ